MSLEEHHLLECKFAQVTALVPKVFAHLKTFVFVFGFHLLFGLENST
jgi:hypothetical protein